jgi:tripartite-type tricarboxylate transporter receptor subunit TctC
MRMHLAKLAAALALAGALPAATAAQTPAQHWPQRAIKIIVPFPAGGPADTAARIPQATMERLLGQSIVVENVPGAAGGIAVGRVLQAEADGHTILQAASPHTTTAAVKPGSIDLLRDFAPIGQTGNSVYTLCATPALGVKTLSEAIARAKEKPGELKIGSVGIGSTHHLIAEMLRAAGGIDLTHVPYRGEAPAILDLVAGRIDLMFLTTAKQYVDAGQVIGLGVTSAEPWFNLPDIPPLAAQGLPGFVIAGWNGFMAPKATPPAAVAKLSATLSAALKTEEAVRAFNAMGFRPGDGTPAQMVAQIETDLRIFTTVIRERNLKFDS